MQFYQMLILSKLDIKVDVNYEVLKDIIDNTDKKDLVKVIEKRIDELVPQNILNRRYDCIS